MTTRRSAAPPELGDAVPHLPTGNRHAAEELVQDTLVRLYPKWDRVSGADKPIAYVQRAGSVGSAVAAGGRPTP